MQNECLVPKSTFFKITLWGLPATQKALNNCFYMRSKLDMVWKSLGCACKQQSWYVGDHQYGQFYWREKKKKEKKKSAWAFCFHSPLRIIPAGEEKMPFSPSFLSFIVQHYQTTSRAKKAGFTFIRWWKGKNKTKQVTINNWSDQI